MQSWSFLHQKGSSMPALAALPKIQQKDWVAYVHGLAGYDRWHWPYELYANLPCKAGCQGALRAALLLSLIFGME